MDFDDLLMRTVNLLELFEDVRNRYRERFRWVLVDEYQDTNHAQYRLLQLLTGEDGNLTVVGDDGQAIYGFRGADVRNILEFEEHFPEAEVVKLEQNYRSTQTILSAANGVISNNRGDLEQEALDRRGGGGEGDRRRARRRARRGPLRRRRDRGPGRRGGPLPRRHRGLLPDQRPEPGAGGHPRPLRAALPGDRRHQVLRAGRDQGRDRLPEPDRQPGRRGQLLARHQLARAAGSATPARGGCAPTPTPPAQTIWEVALRARVGARPRAPPRSSRSAASPS